MRSTLYITYDGLLDPLGGSQILPYLYGIANHPRDVYVLSFEKPRRLERRAALASELAKHGIRWTPLKFTTGTGFVGNLGKIWDLTRMYAMALWLAIVGRVGIVHCRGHVAAQAGALVKRLRGTKLLFDFRGLWVDERVDKGGWDMSRRTHRWQYQFYKRVERRLLAKADQIVVLTEAVAPEVLRLGARGKERVTVIPCCADFDHFPLATVDARTRARERCGLPADALVLGYLGSVGRMYMPERYFRLAELAAGHEPRLYLLALTQDPELFRAEMIAALSPHLHPRVEYRSVARAEVAELLPAMDILVGFIVPSHARMAASPTKMAEAFASGVPVICNFGTGDVAELMARLDAGAIIDADSDTELARVASNLSAIMTKGGARLRELARRSLGLGVAQARYRDIYERMDPTC